MSLHPLIQSYKTLMDFLADLLGRNYEIVLYASDPDTQAFHIEKIINGHISHRTIHSKLSHYELKLIEDEVYLESNYRTHYAVLTDDGQKLFGSTFFIKTGKQLLGMLSINTTHYRVYELINALLAMIPGGKLAVDVLPKTASDKAESEILSNDVADIVQHTIAEIDEKRPNRGPFRKNDKMMLIRELRDKGVFQIKGAIPKVAQILNISDPSVYRYLSEIKKEDEALEQSRYSSR
ncbi:MAG: PAS domain-containing protein [Aerococcus sp.]|nr:PAS domain-containing protein [Aerococcus sp.]